MKFWSCLIKTRRILDQVWRTIALSPKDLQARLERFLRTFGRFTKDPWQCSRNFDIYISNQLQSSKASHSSSRLIRYFWVRNLYEISFESESFMPTEFWVLFGGCCTEIFWMSWNLFSSENALIILRSLSNPFYLDLMIFELLFNSNSLISNREFSDIWTGKTGNFKMRFRWPMITNRNLNREFSNPKYNQFTVACLHCFCTFWRNFVPSFWV